MPVDCVIGDVDLAVGEPPVEGRPRTVENPVGEFMPMNELGLLPPEILSGRLGGRSGVCICVRIIVGCLHG